LHASAYRGSGKWGRAICISGEWAAPISVEPAEVDHPNSLDNFDVVHTACKNATIIDLYSVGDKDRLCETLEQREVLFVHWLLMHGPQGEIVRVKALFDGGAMVGAMCTSYFKKVQH